MGILPYKRVDEDGKSWYSMAVTLRNEASNTLHVRPNPVSDQLTAVIDASGEENIVLELLDLQGKSVISRKFSLILII